MTLLEIIGSILIGPLKLIFEVIFSVAYKVIQHPGPAILVLSLAMNILVLPLYRRADAIQIEARDTENKLKDVVSHIKKTFSGDERMMILQTYYRQNNYNPLSVLSGSISLLLEIPFFMAAYQFLSGVEAFSGAAFGPIADLSAPDGLLQIGGITVNALPIIMTVVNVVSSSLYLKGFPLKTKIQLYGMALFFLVFLYNSPAALVFYWTLNNLFSLIKTLFYRIKHAKKILNVLLGIAGAGCIYLSTVLQGFWRCAFLVCLGIGLQLVWLLPLLKNKLFCNKKERSIVQPNTKLFVFGALFLTVLVGLLIPSAYVAASPQEYIDTSYFYAPIWYVVQSLCFSAGAFMVWLGVFYWLANPTGKVIFSRLVWVLSGVMLVNYMFFGQNLGVVSPNLMYPEGFYFSGAEKLINLGVIAALSVVLYLLCKKFSKQFGYILLVGSIAIASMGVINLVQISTVTEETKLQISQNTEQLPSFNLSQTEENVVVIMLDRGIGPFVPYLMEENPALLEQFDGFTYYSNTLAYGGFTNFTTPSLYGGYDYTPVKLNLRSDELLANKHNEALKVIPSIFSQAGYDITLIDPSYAGYSWIPDLSIYADLEGVSTYHADGRYNDTQSRLQTIAARKRNFFFFSLMKTLPACIQEALYDGGLYRALPSAAGRNDLSGLSPAFVNAYNVLENMDTMTTATEDGQGAYVFLRSNLTHEPVVLQEPYYAPSSTVDNSAYYGAEGKIITAGESTILLDTEMKISHYHSNMLALIQLGNWFDYLRQIGVYDNTRIIIASDHGRFLSVFDDDPNLEHDIDFFLPMLLVKDFGAEGFTTDSTFMTNADVPALSVEGLIENPVNPFTGNKISSDVKQENDTHYVIVSLEYDIGVNNGTQFLPSEWAAVSGSGNVMDKDNWIYYTEKTVLPPTLLK